MRLFKKVKSWFARKQAVENKVDQNKYCVLTITMDADGKLNQIAQFPRFDDSIAKGVAENFAMLVHLLNDGKLLPVLQRAIAIGGGGSDYAQGFAHVVMENLNALTADTTLKRAKTSEKQLVVRPRDTFGFNSPETNR